jgi:hypothetical protein
MINKINKKITLIIGVLIVLFSVGTMFYDNVLANSTGHELVADPNQEYFMNTCTYVSNENKTKSVVVIKKVADKFGKHFDMKIFQDIKVDVSAFNGQRETNNFSFYESDKKTAYVRPLYMNSTTCAKYLRYTDGDELIVDSETPFTSDGYELYSEKPEKPIVNSLKCVYQSKDMKDFWIKNVSFIINEGGSLPRKVSLEQNFKKVFNFPFYNTDGIDDNFTEKLATGNCPKYLFLNPSTVVIFDAFGLFMSWDINSMYSKSFSGGFQMGNTSSIYIYEYVKSEDQINEEIIEVKEKTDQLTQLNDELSSLDCDLAENLARCSELKQKIIELTSEIDVVCKEQFDSSQFEGKTANCEEYMSVRSIIVSSGIIDHFTEGCNMFSPEMKDFINWILNLIKLAGPVVVIVLGTLDFVKAAMSSEADANKKAFDKLVKRLMMAAVIFLIPALIQFIFNYFGVFGFATGLDPSNPFCL